MNVSVVGASPTSERYIYMAVNMLEQEGCAVFPVRPLPSEIDGIRVFKHLTDMPQGVRTGTAYRPPERSTPLAEEILSVRPRHVIFNPGEKNEVLAQMLERKGLAMLEACPLVLLRTDRFDTAGLPGDVP